MLVLSRRNKKSLEKVFGAFILYAHRKKMENHFNKIAAFVFFQNLFKKYLNFFKKNASKKKRMRIIYRTLIHNKLQRLF